MIATTWRRAALFLPLLLAACAPAPRVAAPVTAADRLFAGLAALCGQAFAGRLVTTDAADRDMAAAPLVMHVRACDATTIRVPFHVGDDRSRTWVITRTASGLRLKHDHRHADGSADALTSYGGDSVADADPATARVAFPADAESRAMFTAGGIPQSAANVWTLELRPGALFAYALQRPGRHFRVEFDLSRPVPPPPPPWGAADARR